MAEIQCPYDQMTLKITLLSAGMKIKKFLETHSEDEFVAMLTAIAPGIEDMGGYNRGAAAFHGITVDTLVNSPNYEKMKDEFQNALVGKAIDVLTKKVSLTDKEAWAVLTANELGV